MTPADKQKCEDCGPIEESYTSSHDWAVSIGPLSAFDILRRIKVQYIGGH